MQHGDAVFSIAPRLCIIREVLKAVAQFLTIVEEALHNRRVAKMGHVIDDSDHAHHALQESKVKSTG